jgi:hypothetical protein
MTESRDYVNEKGKELLQAASQRHRSLSAERLQTLYFLTTAFKPAPFRSALASGLDSITLFHLAVSE